mgnify:CR=1 FL=1
MFIVWGTKGYDKDLGYTNLQGSCPNCGNEVTMIGKQIGKKFTLFWIPLFPIKSEQYVLCPICHAGSKGEKADMNRYLQNEVKSDK